VLAAGGEVLGGLVLTGGLVTGVELGGVLAGSVLAGAVAGSDELRAAGVSTPPATVGWPPALPECPVKAVTAA
jgi:hypothetical protein